MMYVIQILHFDFDSYTHDHVLKRAQYQLNCPTNLNAVFRHTFAVSLEWVYVEALWDFPRPNYQQKDKAKN